jgi:hypothetical protein
MSTPDELIRCAQSLGVPAEIVTAPATLPIAEHDAINASPGQVIIDASTLLAAVKTLPVLIEGGLDQARRTCTEAAVAGTLSLIQAAVIHERLWVDALTLARSSRGC